MTGGGKRLKNQRKSSSYFIKISKKLKNLYKKLTFARYDKIGGGDSRFACTDTNNTNYDSLFFSQKIGSRSAGRCCNDRVHSQKLDSRARCNTWTLLFRKIFRKNGIPIHKEDLRTKSSAHQLSLFKKLSLRSANCGAILIEFAVCMPILIILLFYINDLVRLKRLHSQTEFVAQQMANILQNISQKREGTNKKITLSDIRYATSLAYLSIFPGKTEFLSKSMTSDLGYNPFGFIFCVQGNFDSTASVLWTKKFHMAYQTELTPNTVSVDTDNLFRTNVKILSNASPSEIYPTLKINPGEIKIIIECALFYYQAKGYYFTDGRSKSNVSPSQVFGLKIFKLTAPVARDGYANKNVFFHSAVIFTPKPGLFDATPPQEQN